MKKIVKGLILSILGATSMVSFASCDKKNDNERYQTKEEISEAFLKDANKVVINDTNVEFVDANGTNQIINKNPENVCNLYASFTTLWYEAGGNCNEIIGGTAAIELYNEYIGRDITNDEGVTVVATSSSGSKWSTETILSYKPDLIICSTAMSGYKTISGPAESASIPCVAVSYNDFSDYLKWFKVFSAITDNTDLWDSIALKTLDEVSNVILECKDLEGPEVFSMFSGTTKFQANTENTVVGTMIQELGAKNIVSSWANAAGAERLDIDLEAVYSAKPKMILVQCHSSEDEVKGLMDTLYGDNDLWKEIVKNVGESNIVLLEKKLFHNKPNKKFANAYQELAKVLYPNAEFSFE